MRVPLGATNESEHLNKQSTLPLLAKTPLDSSLLLSTAGQCRSRVSRRQSLLDLVFSVIVSPHPSPFHLEASLPIPPLDDIRVPQQGLDSSL
jgi:hypothetical protein